MFQVVFEGEEALQSVLASVGIGLANLRVPMQLSLEALGEGVRETFIEGPEHWEGKKDGMAATLYESGDMYVAAAAAEPGVEHSLYGMEPDGSSGQIGVDDLFHGARRHQFGYGGPDSLGRTFDEPARAFMVVTQEARTNVIELFDAYLEDLSRLGK